MPFDEIYIYILIALFCFCAGLLLAMPLIYLLAVR